VAHSQKIKSIFNKVNHSLDRLIPLTTPLSIVIGILLASVFIHFRPYVPWLFGIMTFSGALKLRAAEFGETIRHPFPILLFFVSSHLLMPAAAMLVSSIVFDNQDIIAGFVLLFAGPTAVSGFIWVSIFKGDKALCLTLILLDTILAPLVVPGTVSILMGAKTTMDMSGIAVSLLFMVVVPTIIGVILNEASRQRLPVIVSPYLDPAAKICLMLVIAANAAAVAPSVRLNDPLIWKAALIVILLTIAGFAVIKLVSVIGKCRAERGITMIVSGGLRNNSAVMTIAVTFFPEATVLPTLLSIVFQQTIAAVMGKLFVKSEERKEKTGE
jgi:predicted Na+-dependent transporter